MLVSWLSVSAVFHYEVVVVSLASIIVDTLQVDYIHVMEMTCNNFCTVLGLPDMMDDFKELCKDATPVVYHDTTFCVGDFCVSLSINCCIPFEDVLDSLHTSAKCFQFRNFTFYYQKGLAEHFSHIWCPQTPDTSQKWCWQCSCMGWTHKTANFHTELGGDILCGVRAVWRSTVVVVPYRPVSNQLTMTDLSQQFDLFKSDGDLQSIGLKVFNETRFSGLMPLARKLFPAPASSAASERVFSRAGLVMRRGRSRL